MNAEQRSKVLDALTEILQYPIMPFDIRVRLEEARATLQASDKAAEQVQEFETWWASEQAKNGYVPIGADYRHWALAGYKAATPPTVRDFTNRIITEIHKQYLATVKFKPYHLATVLGEVIDIIRAEAGKEKS